MFWIGLFMTVTVIWLVYWTVVRPVLLDSVEHELATMRSRVDWAIIEGLPAAQSQPAQRLLADLHEGRGSRLISLGQVIYIGLRERRTLKIEMAKEREIFANSPAWIKDLKTRNSQLAAKAALLNSPAWWIPIAILLLGAVFSCNVAALWRDAEDAAVKVRDQGMCEA